MGEGKTICIISFPQITARGKFCLLNVNHCNTTGHFYQSCIWTGEKTYWEEKSKTKRLCFVCQALLVIYLPEVVQIL